MSHWAVGSDVETLARALAAADGYDPDQKVFQGEPNRLYSRQAYFVPKAADQFPAWYLFADDAKNAIAWMGDKPLF